MWPITCNLLQALPAEAEGSRAERGINSVLWPGSEGGLGAGGGGEGATGRSVGVGQGAPQWGNCREDEGIFVLIVPNYSCHLGVYGQGRGAPSFQKREGRAFTSLKSLARVKRRAGRSSSRLPPVQQVTDEKTCMQFSIRRPKLPSSETHPEESVYRRLDVSAWLGHLNELGQVEEEYKLRKVRPGARGPEPGQVGPPPGVSVPSCEELCEHGPPSNQSRCLGFGGPTQSV